MDFVDQLPQDEKLLLRKDNIETAQDILFSSKFRLQQIGFTNDRAQQLKVEAAFHMNISFSTAKKTLDSTKWKRLSFGCRGLDLCTEGGILTRGITEICGESGSGKTQISLQLSLMVQLPEIYGGLNKGAIYICTEQPFQSKRLFQMIEHFNTIYPSCSATEYSENVFVKHIFDIDNLLNCVKYHIPNLMKIQNIGLIVIDSVAGVFRIGQNYVDRANDMRKLANFLLSLVDEYQCAVICLNQVSSDVGGSTGSGGVKNEKSDADKPSLGIAWANLVRTRIKTSKCSIIPSLRKFEVLFTPDGNCESCEFMISLKGIVDISDNN